MLVATGTRERPEQPTVLVVSSDDALADVLSYNLKQAGFVPSRNCEQPDLVLVDLQNSETPPGYRGGVPVMALVDATETAIRAAISGGARDFLTKPFAPSALIPRLRALLR